MADRLTGGRLASLIAAYRAEGLSWDDVARKLYDDGGVEANGETIRKWATALGIGAAA